MILGRGDMGGDHHRLPPSSTSPPPEQTAGNRTAARKAAAGPSFSLEGAADAHCTARRGRADTVLLCTTRAAGNMFFVSVIVGTRELDSPSH
uniref:Uncharacterized protein n=2 Tax=Oryza glumipatula TaxID=40148 RepID=A0A0D9ZQD9_9ORYZ